MLKPQYIDGTLYISEGTLVVLSGLPGSGKSSVLREGPALESVTWLSSDALRDEISPPQRMLVEGRVLLRRAEAANTLVFEILRNRVRAALALGRTVVVDATNLTDADRKDWITLANDAGAPHVVVILDTPVDECLRRAAAREYWVPDSVIQTMKQPPLPQLSEAVLKNVRRPDAKVPITAPQGFQNSSAFNHVVWKDGDRLHFTWNDLPQEKWDVVGDVHGLYPDLLILLDKAGWPVQDGKLKPHPDNRRLLFLGDLVDRGQQSVEVVRLVYQACKDGLAMAIKGNHELKLVRFLQDAVSKGVESWTSYANAETGMRFLKLEEAERKELTEFLHFLPPYLVDRQNKVVFLHANPVSFELGRTLVDDCVLGHRIRDVDTDRLYQKGVEAGFNKFTLIRGHIPQTSEQPNVISLERHPFQKGELLLLRYDLVAPTLADASADEVERKLVLTGSTITQACDFDFDQHAAKEYSLIRGMEKLAAEKHVTRGYDDSKMFRVYKYSKQTFWNNAWSTSELLLKARGLVLDPAGNIVSHPFDKTFNYLENGTGKDIPDSQNVVTVDKLNGFLGIISMNPLKRGDLLVHTQGGFGGPFVQYIRDHISSPLRSKMVRYFLKNDVTLLFEVLHEEDPHIIEYSKEQMGLYLIGVRGKGRTDLAWTEEAVDEVAQELGLRRPTWTLMSFGEAREMLRDLKAEGFMVRADNTQQDFLLKMKSPYYLTTKFLGRLSKGKTKFMFANPKEFKQTVDEEFYVIVDAILRDYTLESFLELEDAERVAKMRDLINAMQ